LAELDANYPGCRWLMHRAGERLWDFEKSWRTATQVAGVAGLLFHDLRRTALTNMENAGIPRSVATSISGHKTEAVYRRYVIRRADAIEKAGEQMEAYLNSARKAVNGHSIGHSGKVNQSRLSDNVERFLWFRVEPAKGIEPPTLSLQVRCSTN
jgi:integrase-like protein